LVDTFGNVPRWIGLYRPGGPPDSPWVWVNGDSLVYSNWGPGQPDLLWLDHDYASICLFSDQVGMWHNTDNFGYPAGAPSTGIMERPLLTGVRLWPESGASRGEVKELFR
jgi:hypothetical protein